MVSVLGTSYQDTFPPGPTLLDNGFEEQLYTDHPDPSPELQTPGKVDSACPLRH